jgi:hypothetical protein
MGAHQNRRRRKGEKEKRRIGEEGKRRRGAEEKRGALLVMISFSPSLLHTFPQSSNVLTFIRLTVFGLAESLSSMA